jgi:hypothetical protein
MRGKTGSCLPALLYQDILKFLNIPLTGNELSPAAPPTGLAHRDFATDNMARMPSLRRQSPEVAKTVPQRCYVQWTYRGLGLGRLLGAAPAQQRDARVLCVDPSGANGSAPCAPRGASRRRRKGPRADGPRAHGASRTGETAAGDNSQVAIGEFSGFYMSKRHAQSASARPTCRPVCPAASANRSPRGRR